MALREKQARFEKRAQTLKETEDRISSMQSEISRLKEQLHQEEIQRLLKEQSVSELQGRIRSLEESEKGLEAMVREKQEAILGESRTLEGQKQRTRKYSEKVGAIKMEFQQRFKPMGCNN